MKDYIVCIEGRYCSYMDVIDYRGVDSWTKAVRKE